MRLSQKDIETIKQVISRELGGEARVSLFGSRLDDDKKGGDIDLLVTTDPQFYTVKHKINVLVALKKQLGDQKIDLVFDKKPESSFLKLIKMDAVLL